MAIINTAKFNFPMQGLYIVANTVCDLCERDISLWESFSPLYNQQFFTALRTQIATADNMPGANNRTARRSYSLVELKAAKQDGIINWKKLISYIKKTWKAPDMRRSMLRDAGSTLYRKASGASQWATALDMFSNGAAFIQTHNEALNSSKAMPHTFQAQYIATTNDFKTKWAAQIQVGGTNQVDSSDKRRANNNLYDMVTELCKDAQIIHSTKRAMRKQYTITRLIRQAGYGGTAGISATFTYGPNNLPIADVDGVSTDLKYAGISNAKGILKINRMTEGEHTFTFSAEGFKDLVATVTLQAGVKSRFAFTLQQEVMEVQEGTLIANAA